MTRMIHKFLPGSLAPWMRMGYTGHPPVIGSEDGGRAESATHRAGCPARWALGRPQRVEGARSPGGVNGDGGGERRMGCRAAGVLESGPLAPVLPL
jgi:hypothetical protein